MPFTLVEGAEARQLLIAHAFRATPDQRRRLADAAAPGTPMEGLMESTPRPVGEAELRDALARAARVRVGERRF